MVSTKKLSVKDMIR